MRRKKETGLGVLQEIYEATKNTWNGTGGKSIANLKNKVKRHFGTLKKARRYYMALYREDPPYILADDLKLPLSLKQIFEGLEGLLREALRNPHKSMEEIVSESGLNIPPEKIPRLKEFVKKRVSV